MVGVVGEVFLGGEMSKFGEDGERLREDRASFLLGLANGLQYISFKSCVILFFFWIYLSAVRLSKVARHWMDRESRGEMDG